MRIVPPPTIKGYAFKEIENDKVEDEDVDEEKEDEEVDPDEILHHSHIDKTSNADEEDDVVDSTDEDDDLEVKKPEPVKTVPAKKVTAAKKK